MKLHVRPTLLAFGLWMTAQAGWADPITFNVTLFSVPGSTSTTAIGINNASQIVGDYTDSAGSTHGFLDINGTFTTLDFPGSTYTAATGINNVGQIVGFYSGGAFLYQNGTYTNLNLPVPTPNPHFSPAVTDQLAINDLGQIVGTGIGGGAGYSRAFLYANGQVTFLPPVDPLNPGSSAFGINNAGAIAGLADYGCCTTAYVYANGQYTTIGGDSSTAYGINNAGDILLDTEVTNGLLTCLVNLTGQPGPPTTTKGCVPPIDPHILQFGGTGRGLNDLDQIVGPYGGGGTSFLATPVPEPTSILLLASGLAGVGLLVRQRRAKRS